MYTVNILLIDPVICVYNAYELVIVSYRGKLHV